jgi:hypothetical protein
VFVLGGGGYKVQEGRHQQIRKKEFYKSAIAWQKYQESGRSTQNTQMKVLHIKSVMGG